MMIILLFMAMSGDVPAARMIQPGPLSLAQVRANIAERFAALDANRDGAVDRAEAEGAAARFRAAANASTGRRIVSDISGGDGDTAWFDACDANHDGKVTLIELGAQPLANFAALDSDHDGVLSVAERQTGLQRRP